NANDLGYLFCSSFPRRPLRPVAPWGLDRSVAVLISDSLAWCCLARVRKRPKRSLCARQRRSEEGMPTFVGFNTFAGLPEEQISEKIRHRILAGDQAMLVWWSIEAGVHVEPHSHANEQIAWMLKGKMEFRLGSEQRVCGPGDVVLIPGGAEHEAWFREDTEVIDFFAPPREDFLVGGKPAYMSEGEASGNAGPM